MAQEAPQPAPANCGADIFGNGWLNDGIIYSMYVIIYNMYCITDYMFFIYGYLRLTVYDTYFVVIAIGPPYYIMFVLFVIFIFIAFVPQEHEREPE